MAIVPSFQDIRSSLGRTKSSQCPPVPATLNQVHIAGVFARTFLGERFLLHLDNFTGVALFATDTELNVLGRCRTIYVDGTFKTAPRPYKQVFTIHGEYNNRVIPFAHGLLSGKTQHHYDVLFTHFTAFSILL